VDSGESLLIWRWYFFSCEWFCVDVCSVVLVLITRRAKDIPGRKEGQEYPVTFAK